MNDHWWRNGTQATSYRGPLSHSSGSAQRNGLLQEPRIDEEAADPYFAHCRLHTDKTQIR